MTNELKLPYDPKINRWTGEPHKHEREIARNKRRQKVVE